MILILLTGGGTLDVALLVDIEEAALVEVETAALVTVGEVTLDAVDTIVVVADATVKGVLGPALVGLIVAELAELAPAPISAPFRLLGVYLYTLSSDPAPQNSRLDPLQSMLQDESDVSTALAGRLVEQ